MIALFMQKKKFVPLGRIQYSDGPLPQAPKLREIAA